MSKLVSWSRPVYDEFLSIALLTDDEQDVIEAHVIKHWSRVQMQLNLSMGETKLDETMYALKVKYWDAAKFSELLRSAWVGPPVESKAATHTLLEVFYTDLYS